MLHVDRVSDNPKHAFDAERRAVPVRLAPEFTTTRIAASWIKMARDLLQDAGAIATRRGGGMIDITKLRESMLMAMDAMGDGVPAYLCDCVNELSCVCEGKGWVTKGQATELRKCG